MGPAGGSRLDDPDDVLRQEVPTALRVGVSVIPVLFCISTAAGAHDARVRTVWES
jgi:hypothetical protein